MKLRTFAIDYPYGGKTYEVHIVADSWEDADARLRAIQNYGVIDGEIMGSVPYMPGANLWVRLVCWWQNRKSAA